MGHARHVELTEWASTDKLGPIENPVLQGYLLRGDDERRLARELAEQQVLTIHEQPDGTRVSARAHVGRISLGELTVTVKPKLPGDALFRLFAYAYGLKRLRTFDSSEYATSGRLFQDFLIAQLEANARDVIDRGLSQTYQKRSERLGVLRGRIDFRALAARHGQPEATLPCRFHERTEDHVLNQVLSAGLKLAANACDTPALKNSIGRLQLRLRHSVQPLRLSAHTLTLAKQRINRLTSHYSEAIELVSLLYESRFLNLDDEASGVRLPGFLFDMNRFFEALLGRFLGENLHGFEVETQHKLRNMVRYMPNANPRGKQNPRMRPDFAIKKDGRILALLDAKYRDLWERDLPRDMLYQLMVYGMSQGPGSTAAILYPTTSHAARPAILEVQSPATGRNITHVALRPVNLVTLERLITSDTAESKRELRELARKLAGVEARESATATEQTTLQLAV